MKIEIEAVELMDLLAQQERQVRANIQLVQAQEANPEGRELAVKISEIIRFIRYGDKVGAIKIVRDMTGIDLKEAYDLVDGNLIF
jgi:ribosomal protein L7/L12